MIIQIIGAGCAVCKHMEADVRAVAARLGLDATIERVDDLEHILRLELLALPRLVVNGEVITTGYGGQKRSELPRGKPRGIRPGKIEKALREWCERGAL